MALFAQQQSQAKRILVMPDPTYRPGQRPSFDSLIQQIQTLTSTIDKLEKRIAELDKEVRDGGYINRNEFNAAIKSARDDFGLAIGKMVPAEGRYWLVEKLVFGGVVVVLLAVGGAILYSIGLRT